MTSRYDQRGIDVLLYREAEATEMKFQDFLLNQLYNRIELVQLISPI